MKRTVLTLVVMALLIVCRQARAQSYYIYTSGTGWIESPYGTNGNASNNNYFAGSDGETGEYRNHFDFQIPSVSGRLTGATLNLSNPSHEGHEGPTNTFSVYSIGAFGTYGFNDIGKGTLYGSLSISGDGAEEISLNAAAIAAIVADQGGTFSLGGVDSGQNAYPAADYDFGGTDGLATLSLFTVAPEPSSLILLAFGAAGLMLAARRRKA